PSAQPDDVVTTISLSLPKTKDPLWATARAEPVRTLAEFFGHSSAWMRDVLCALLRQSRGRDGGRPALLPLDGGPSGAPRYEPGSRTADGEQVQRWTELHEAAARLPDDLRAGFDLLWYQELWQAEAAGLLGLPVRTGR